MASGGLERTRELDFVSPERVIAPMQATHSDPAFWARRLAVQQSPVFEASLREAVGFFRGGLPGISDIALESHLRPIDWSWRDCKVVPLRPGERIYAYRYDPMGKVGMYFTRSGYAARDLGIDPVGRTRTTYLVTSATDALWCRTRSIVTTWDPSQPTYLAVGGAMQLIVLHARKKVQLEIAVEKPRR